MIGTYDGIIFGNRQKGTVRQFTSEQMGGGHIITSICKYKGLYYIGTYDGGMKLFDPSSMCFLPQNIDNSLNTATIMIVKVSPTGQLWIGTSDGLFVTDGISLLGHYTENNSRIVGGGITSISFDPSGNAWLTGSYGQSETSLSICQPSFVMQSDNFPKNFFNNVKPLRGRKGHGKQMLFFSDFDIYITDINMTQFGELDIPAPIMSNRCVDLTDDMHGYYWIATEKSGCAQKVLIDKSEGNGIKFGIWIEPEMVNPKSELAEQHPDWIIRLPKRDTYYLRNQLVLDMTNPKVQDFVFSVVDNLMKENPRIAYFKWDCNSPMTNIFSSYEGREQGRLYVDYVRGLYKVLERVRAAYPDVTMMLCASGGSRCDIEALKYFDEYWVSDDTDPVERLYIQWGCSHFLPTKAMCAHVTDWNKRASIKFRTDVAMSCKLGFDIALNKLSAEDREYCHEATKEWNRLKDLIFSPNLYRLQSPYESDHCVMQRVSDDKSRSVVFAYDIHPRFRASILPVKLCGLDAAATYEVKEICLAKGQKPMEWHERSYSGEYLMTVGLKMTTEKDMQSLIIEITKK
ncbi:MAG: alpha-galactosidase [Prevotella sp.]